MDWTNAEVSHSVPTEQRLAKARASLVCKLPEAGLGEAWTQEHLLGEIAPGFTSSSRCASYFAYTTGAVTDAALFADWVASTYDQNVAVHLPSESVATKLESVTLRLLQQLLGFDEDVFVGRIFTTGATASNLLGLALGREFVVAEAGRRKTVNATPHSSLYKAAAVLGLGRDSVLALPRSEDETWKFDLEALEAKLADGASIVSVSAGEVSSGKFATDGQDMQRIRDLADKYGAWVHVDGVTFGLQARVLPHTESYRHLTDGVSNLELADSLAGDCHKLLQTPYDCGFFFTRHLDVQQCVFRNPNAAYLSATPSQIPSPLNIGLENSRRFRALPVYATLLAYGRPWYRELLEGQIALARRIARYIVDSDAFELLPNDNFAEVYMVVLFRAKDAKLNESLVARINTDTRIHVSGLPGGWRGKPAARIAVGSWRVEGEREFTLIVDILETVVRESMTT
ncbi:hypothetical protein HMN09_00827200 [Mycena chlorophos]|uniref:Pyridoxal-dependent decarboxylase n=1 Tax=Mycena chlorophos TaxID=658473 RepID=A0A8H6W3H3_MYCCL|nr:hypothetical protein HMN09_00827200 [Mycena chlorophos]